MEDKLTAPDAGVAQDFGIAWLMGDVEGEPFAWLPLDDALLKDPAPAEDAAATGPNARA